MLDRIGYYNEAYIRYGYEDSGRNDRARRALGCAGYPSPIRASAYIHSQDVFGECPKPNMTPEAKEAAIMANRSIWLAELASPRLLYAYPRAVA
jgi:hypothetical protein